MPQIQRSSPVTGLVDKKAVSTDSQATHHAITIIECSKPGVSFTIKRKVIGSDAEHAITSAASMVVGETAYLLLPHTNQLLVEPSDATAQYSMIVGSH